MPYVQTDPTSGAVVGVFANPQSFATEFLDDSDSTVVAFLAAMTPPPSLTFLQFMALFTSAEQTAIVNSTDTQVKLFILMATGAGLLQLSNAEVIAGVNYLVSTNVLTSARGTQILAGAAPT